MYNNDLFNLLKQIAVNAVASTKPCNWCYGYVKSSAPLKVALSDKLEIDSDFIEFGSFSEENLEPGDKLILLQKAGGQFFLLLNIIKNKR